MQCTGQTKKGARCRKPAAEASGVCAIHRGTGIIDFVKRRIHTKPRNHATARFQKLLNNDEITEIRVGRAPVISGVKKALNIMSLGGFDRTRKKLGYNDVYHQYLIVTLRDGRKFRVEKNHVIEATQVPDHYGHSGKNENESKIPVPPNTTLRSLIDNASKGNSSFWNYNPASNNCQSFVSSVIKNNDLHLTPQAETIVKKQDGEKLIDSLPGILRELPNAVTNIAAVGDRVLHGDGLRLNRRLERR